MIVNDCIIVWDFIIIHNSYLTFFVWNTVPFWCKIVLQCPDFSNWWLDLLLRAVAECLAEIIFFFWAVYDYFQHSIENNIKKLKIKIFICRYNNLKCHYMFWWFYSSGQHDYHLQCVTLNKAIINIACCKTLDNSK